MTTNETTKNQKDSSKKGLFIGFIIILLGINGYQYFLSTENHKVIEEKVVIIKEKTDENKSLIASIDSTLQVIQQQKDEYAKLGVEKADLEALNIKLEEQKRALQADAGYKKKYFKVQKELNEIKTMLSENGGEIDKIKAEREALFTANNQLKEEKNKLTDSISQISVKTTALEQKVKIASQLLAINIKTTVINKKSKELDEVIYKAKNIDKLNIKFNYADNKVAEVGGHTIYLRVIEPDGATLSDPANGSGTYNLEGQDVTYTAMQEHLFDNSQKTIAFLFSKPNGGYKPGKYLVEIYTDGYKSGSGSFLVK